MYNDLTYMNPDWTPVEYEPVTPKERKEEPKQISSKPAKETVSPNNTVVFTF